PRTAGRGPSARGAGTPAAVVRRRPPRFRRRPAGSPPRPPAAASNVSWLCPSARAGVTAEPEAQRGPRAHLVPVRFAGTVVPCLPVHVRTAAQLRERRDLHVERAAAAQHEAIAQAELLDLLDGAHVHGDTD